jgi:predicted RNA-binding Zn-ribbon protein involved in translation (DUF1610 family)
VPPEAQPQPQHRRVRFNITRAVEALGSDEAEAQGGRTISGRSSGALRQQSGRVTSESRHDGSFPLNPSFDDVEFFLPSDQTHARAGCSAPGTPASFPRSCVLCHTRLRWSPPALEARCPACGLSAVVRCRVVEQPRVPAAWRALGERGDVMEGSVGPTHQSVTARRPLSVETFAWATVRVLPMGGRELTLPQGVAVCDADEVVAILSVRQARFLRACLLQRLTQLHPQLRLWEGDVAAYLDAWCQRAQSGGGLPTPPMGPFRGDQHVFAPWDVEYEPPLYRRARLSSALQPPLWDPATSAYTPVQQYGAPLRADGYKSVLARHHPQFGFLVNSCNFGFPLLTNLPASARWCPSAPPGSARASELRKAVQIEVDTGSFVRVPEGVAVTPLREAPMLAIPKPSGGVRGVFDGTFEGTGVSINAASHRGGHPRARLAQFDTSCVTSRTYDGMRMVGASCWRNLTRCEGTGIVPSL